MKFARARTHEQIRSKHPPPASICQQIFKNQEFRNKYATRKLGTCNTTKNARRIRCYWSERPNQNCNCQICDFQNFQFCNSENSENLIGPDRSKVINWQRWTDQNEARCKCGGLFEPELEIWIADFQFFKNARKKDIWVADPPDQDFVWKHIFRWPECFA